MALYRFPKNEINGVISHISAFDATILSMTPDVDDYIVELDIGISQEQYEHLVESYNFVEVL